MEKRKIFKVILIWIITMSLALFVINETKAVEAGAPEMDKIEGVTNISDLNDTNTFPNEGGLSFNIAAGNLNTRRNMFCFQYGQHFSGSPKFRLQYAFKIFGNRLQEVWIGKDINGNPITVPNFHLLADGGYAKDENAVLSYIIGSSIGSSGGYSAGEGYGKYTAQQLALYRYLNTWTDNVGATFSVNIHEDNNNNAVSKSSDANERLNNAYGMIAAGQEYAQNFKKQNNQTILKDNGTDKKALQNVKSVTINKKDYMQIGPVKIEIGSNLASIKVEGTKANSNNLEEITGIVYTRKENGEHKIVKASDIGSGIAENETSKSETFYINIPVDSDFTSINKIEMKLNNVSIRQYSAYIFVYFANNSTQRVSGAKGGSADIPVESSLTIDINTELFVNIEITKVKKGEEKTKLPNVKFILQYGDNDINSKTYVIRENGTYKYTSNRANATQFSTGGTGNTTIKKLKPGTYYLYEISNPNKRYRFDSEKKIKLKVNENNKIENDDLYAEISGYVWLEKAEGKTSTNANGLHDEGEKAVNNMTVRLKTSTGKIVKYRYQDEAKQREAEEKGTLPDQITTTSKLGIYSEITGGQYIFYNVLDSKLEDYYVEFEYDGLIYQSTKLQLKKDNGSKATDQSVRDKIDEKCKSVDPESDTSVKITGTKYSIKYTGTYSTETAQKVSTINKAAMKNNSEYQVTIQATTKDANFNIKNNAKCTETEKEKTYKYINLGIYERTQADMRIHQDLDSVNVSINGTTCGYLSDNEDYTRDYNKEDTSDNQIGVKFRDVEAARKGTGGKLYHQAIYQEDYKYTNSDPSKELKVTLTYYIDLINESALDTKVNSVTAYIDTRYKTDTIKVSDAIETLNSDTQTQTRQLIGNIQTILSTDVKDVSGSSNYKKFTFKTDGLGVIGGIGSSGSNYKRMYMQVELSRQMISDMLTGVISNDPLSTVAEINSYTVYKSSGKTVLAVDNDSVVSNANPETIKTYEDDTDPAYPVKLEQKADDESRKSTGFVFEDKTSINGNNIRIGNGYYDNGETIISQGEGNPHNIKITMISEDNSNLQYEGTINSATGEYLIEKFIPGKYKIKFEWGDDTYKVQTYKATLYDDRGRTGRPLWYTENVEIRKSDALDNYQTRANIDAELQNLKELTDKGLEYGEYDYGINTILNENAFNNKRMDSWTPTMILKTESEANPSITLTDTNTQIEKTEYKIENVDLGIALRPLQSLSIDKQVKSYNLALQNGQTIAHANFKENGEVDKETSESVLDYTSVNVRNNGADIRGSIRTEIDSELLDGANLSVTYAIKCTNTSETDYADEAFYNYYQIPTNAENKIIRLTPSIIVDHLDNKYVFSPELEGNNIWKELTLKNGEYIYKDGNNEIVTKYALNPNFEPTDESVSYKEINDEFKNNYARLQTDALKNEKLKPGQTSSSLTLTVTKGLKASGTMSYHNFAQIAVISKSTNEYTKPTPDPVGNIGVPPTRFPTREGQEISISPSTGENKNYTIPITIGVSAMVILGVGIIIIMKKVLDGKNKKE